MAGKRRRGAEGGGCHWLGHPHSHCDGCKESDKGLHLSKGCESPDPGKKWLPGPRNTTTHGQGADLAHLGLAPMLPSSRSSVGMASKWLREEQVLPIRTQHLQTVHLDAENWSPPYSRESAFVLHLCEPPLPAYKRGINRASQNGQGFKIDNQGLAQAGSTLPSLQSSRMPSD